MSLKTVKAYLDLCRVSNLPTVWTNVLAAVVLSGATFSWWNWIILAVSLSLFYSGGMCLNDICDVAVDRVKRQNRPIPLGRVPLPTAWIFTVLLFAGALLLLCAVSFRHALLPGLALLALIIAYDFYHKKSSLSILLMAACRLMVFVVAAMAVTGTVATPAALAGLAQFGYVLVISAVARYENRQPKPFPFPVIPAMLAGISLLDGVLLAVLVSPAWLAAGLAGMALTILGQQYVRGD